MDDSAIGKAMAGMRDRFAPEPNADGAKATVCGSCGAEFWQWERQYFKRCSTCGAERSAEAVTASRSKSGPAYEKVVRGSLRYWLGEAARIGLTPGT